MCLAKTSEDSGQPVLMLISVRYPPKETLDTWLSAVCPVKTPIRLIQLFIGRTNGVSRSIYINTTFLRG